MSVNIIFRIAAVGILVTILVQVLKHSGRDEQAFLITLAGLILVLGWVIPYQAFLPPDTSHVRLHLPAFGRRPFDFIQGLLMFFALAVVFIGSVASWMTPAVSS